MIYICFEHINGEFERVLNNIYTEKDALILKDLGYIVILINLFTGKVKEI